MHGLRPHRLPFLEAQRPIVHARGQAEAVFGEGRLAAEVAAIHAADLRDGDVALVGEDERVVGQIFEQSRRRLAGAAAGEIARIVLDALRRSRSPPAFRGRTWCAARAAALRAGGRALLSSSRRALQLVLDALDRLQQRRARRDVMRIGVDFDELELLRLLAGQRIELDDRFHLVAEEADAPGAVLVMGGEQLDRVAAHAERAAREIAWSVRLYCSATRSAMSWRWSRLSPSLMPKVIAV